MKTSKIAFLPFALLIAVNALFAQDIKFAQINGTNPTAGEYATIEFTPVSGWEIIIDSSAFDVTFSIKGEDVTGEIYRPLLSSLTETTAKLAFVPAPRMAMDTIKAHIIWNGWVILPSGDSTHVQEQSTSTQLVVNTSNTWKADTTMNAEIYDLPLSNLVYFGNNSGSHIDDSSLPEKHNRSLRIGAQSKHRVLKVIVHTHDAKDSISVSSSDNWVNFSARTPVSTDSLRVDYTVISQSKDGKVFLTTNIAYIPVSENQNPSAGFYGADRTLYVGKSNPVFYITAKDPENGKMTATVAQYKLHNGTYHLNHTWIFEDISSTKDYGALGEGKWRLVYTLEDEAGGTDIAQKDITVRSNTRSAQWPRNWQHNNQFRPAFATEIASSGATRYTATLATRNFDYPPLVSSSIVGAKASYHDNTWVWSARAKSYAEPIEVQLEGKQQNGLTENRVGLQYWKRVDRDVLLTFGGGYYNRQPLDMAKLASRARDIAHVTYGNTWGFNSTYTGTGLPWYARVELSIASKGFLLGYKAQYSRVSWETTNSFEYYDEGLRRWQTKTEEATVTDSQIEFGAQALFNIADKVRIGTELELKSMNDLRNGKVNIHTFVESGIFRISYHTEGRVGLGLTF